MGQQVERQKRIVIESQYFPCVEYFTILEKADEVFIERQEHFQKQSYRNRSYILTANKIDRLTVPVLGANKGLPIGAMEIDYKHKWQHRHWKAIESAYARAPFFEFYQDYFKEIIFTDFQYLIDLNKEILGLCSKLLGLKSRIYYTEEYIENYQETGIDLRSEIHPKKATGLTQLQEYVQVFGDNFEPNLSILDLLFCEGPNAIRLLRNQDSVLLHKDWGIAGHIST
ncbi:WbqC family protein [Limibacter armeniacum]|uniref:WbqC family protein n=1 Tax=Limibacter armeniacum TaxID=466084 RepID=UPI002FE63E54